VVGLSRTRGFHASKPNLIINEAFQLSSTLFYFVHDTSGLSWGLSIPLTGALCQLAFTPLHYAVERNTKLRAQGTALLAAYRTAFQEQVRVQENSIKTEAGAVIAESEVKRKLRAKTENIQGVLGYKGNWLNFILLSYIPVWLSNVGALVEMCGFTEEDSKAIAASGLNSVVVEPTLTTDGMLWFTDLTIADPLCLLPIATGCLFLTSVLTMGRRSTGKPTALQSVLLTFALLTGPLYIALGVSNAVLLAMMGSTVVTIVRRPVLDRVFGKSLMVKPAQPRLAVPKKQYRVLEA
jgi:inner membrane protein COX18